MKQNRIFYVCARKKREESRLISGHFLFRGGVALICFLFALLLCGCPEIVPDPPEPDPTPEVTSESTPVTTGEPTGFPTPEPTEEPTEEPTSHPTEGPTTTPIHTTIELGDITGPDDHQYICYEDSRGNTISHSFTVPSCIEKILSGTIYVRYTNNDPEGYLRACNLTINNEPSHCSTDIGCYRVGNHQVRGFTASRGQTVEKTFDIMDVMFPVYHPDTGSIQVDLSQALVPGENFLISRVTHGTGEGSRVSVRIALEVELSTTLELGAVTGPDDRRYVCYEDSRGNTVSHSFHMPYLVKGILSGTIYVRYTNNDPEGYLRACNLTINNEPSHCSTDIGCYRVGNHQVRGFTAGRGQTVERTFNIMDVMFPVNYPATGSIQVDLSQALVAGENFLTSRVTHGSGEGSFVTVRIVIEPEY